MGSHIHHGIPSEEREEGILSSLLNINDPINFYSQPGPKCPLSRVIDQLNFSTHAKDESKLIVDGISMITCPEVPAYYNFSPLNYLINAQRTKFHFVPFYLSYSNTDEIKKYSIFFCSRERGRRAPRWWPQRGRGTALDRIIFGFSDPPRSPAWLIPKYQRSPKIIVSVSPLV